MKTPELTLYFDGNCPFCLAGMTRLKMWNSSGKLGFVDISDANFDPHVLGVDMAALDRQLHSLTQDGRVLVGIDSMLVAYTLVGKSWMVLPLRVKMLRPILSYFYRQFARHRYTFSRWLGYKPVNTCSSASCKLQHAFFQAKR